MSIEHISINKISTYNYQYIKQILTDLHTFYTEHCIGYKKFNRMYNNIMSGKRSITYEDIIEFSTIRDNSTQCLTAYSVASSRITFEHSSSTVANKTLLEIQQKIEHIREDISVLENKIHIVCDQLIPSMYVPFFDKLHKYFKDTPYLVLPYVKDNVLVFYVYLSKDNINLLYMLSNGTFKVVSSIDQLNKFLYETPSYVIRQFNQATKAEIDKYD